MLGFLTIVVLCIMFAMALSVGLLSWMIAHPLVVIAAVAVVALYEWLKAKK